MIVFIDCIYYLCEPAAWNEDRESGYSYADKLWECGIPVERASKEKTHGIIQTQEMFGRTGHQGENLVFVHENCGRFRFEIKNYVYDKENKAVDKDDHLMECMYRLVCHDGLTYHNPKPVNKPITDSVNIDTPDLSLPNLTMSI